MPEKVIVNTSPIFYLHRIRRLNLIEKLYGNVTIPSAVLRELEEGEKVGEDVPTVTDFNWIKVQYVKIPLYIRMIPDLGKGEAEVLALGCEETNPLLIIDDALARKIAGLQKLKFTGTAGILLKAKHKGYIKKIGPIIKQLKENGFYLSDMLIKNILIIAEET